MSTPIEEAPAIDLALDGPSEPRWATVTDTLPSFDWAGSSRLIVVSPHPDDETLGAGGLVASAVERGLAVIVISVTDGDAAFPHDDLAAVRRAELTSALQCLSTGATIGGDRLGIPDGHVAAHVEELATHLRGMIRGDDLVVCPLDDDGHPDHDATAWAALSAALGCQAAVRCYPLWAWHCHDPEHSPIARGTRLHLSPAARSAKRAAIACYTSQLGGPDPVVPARMLARLDRAFEVYVTPEGSR